MQNPAGKSLRVDSRDSRRL